MVNKKDEEKISKSLDNALKEEGTDFDFSLGESEGPSGSSLGELVKVEDGTGIVGGLEDSGVAEPDMGLLLGEELPTDSYDSLMNIKGFGIHPTIKNLYTNDKGIGILILQQKVQVLFGYSLNNEQRFSKKEAEILRDGKLEEMVIYIREKIIRSNDRKTLPYSADGRKSLMSLGYSFNYGESLQNAIDSIIKTAESIRQDVQQYIDEYLEKCIGKKPVKEISGKAAYDLQGSQANK